MSDWKISDKEIDRYIEREEDIEDNFDETCKRVHCLDCGHSDFIDSSGNGWEFVGYDDGVELHRCPSCQSCVSSI